MYDDFLRTYKSWLLKAKLVLFSLLIGSAVYIGYFEYKESGYVPGDTPYYVQEWENIVFLVGYVVVLAVFILLASKLAYIGLISMDRERRR